VVQEYAECRWHVAYEACGFGYELAWWLEEQGIVITVVAPSRVERTPGRSVKTDKIDACKLAEKLEKRALKGCYVPRRREHERRQLSRTYEQALTDRKRAQVRVRSLLQEHGRQGPEPRAGWSAYKRWLEEQDFPAPVAFCVEELLKLRAAAASSVERLKYRLELLAQAPEYAPIVEAIRGYLTSDYDYERDVKQLRENRDAAIAGMWALVPSTVAQADRDKLRSALDLALKMTPLTPDHHFYMDQGTYARVRLVLMAVGRKLAEQSVFQEADDVMFLTYHELRVISADPAAFDVKSLVAQRRTQRQAAFGRRPRLWAGTITHWSLHEEPYKQGNWDWPGIYERSKEAARPAGGKLRGLGASAGVVEGTARVVDSPEQFDQVQKGELLICKMTSPAWVVLFTKIAGLVTDSGGALSHPAVVSREFGIPAVVGTRTATQTIKTGQRLRVDGAAGTVEVLG